MVAVQEDKALECTLLPTGKQPINRPLFVHRKVVLVELDGEIAAYRVPWLFAVSRANAVGDERQVFFKVFLRPRNADELHDAPTKGEEDARVQERGIRAKISLSACSSAGYTEICTSRALKCSR
jgi:hypothetical protein